MRRDALCQLLELEDQQKASIQPKWPGSHGNYSSQTIDIALLDIEMPYASGLDVLGVVYKITQRLAVLIFTTFRCPGYFERAHKADVDAFVLKERPVHALMETPRKHPSGQERISA